MEQNQTNTNLAIFDSIVEEMRRIYIAKNADYGSSFDKSMSRYGLTSLAVRLFDKFNRFENLASGKEPQVKGESIADTLLDIANYAILGLIYMTKAQGEGDGFTKEELAEMEERLSKLMQSYQEVTQSKDESRALSVLDEVNAIAQEIKLQGKHISNATEISQALNNMRICLGDIIDTHAADNVPELDAALMYDYQTLCAYLHNPTVEGFADAYQTAQKIMNTDVKDWGAYRDFTNQVISVAEQVISMHDGAEAPMGKVVPFKQGQQPSAED